MNTPTKGMKELAYTVENHSLEGVDILHSEPSKLIEWMIYTLVWLLLSGVIWSFYGHADVIVSAQGTFMPESGVRRVYTPINGELIDIYVTEGMPVQAGDILARIKAKDAINIANELMTARLKLADAERNYRLLPERKHILELKRDSSKRKLEIEKKKHKRREKEDLTKLASQQRIKLKKARARLKEAERRKDYAKQELEKYQRLLALPGGGGISKQKVDEKRNAFLAAMSSFNLIESEFGELDLKLTTEYDNKRTDIEISNQNLMDLKVAYENSLSAVEGLDKQVLFALRVARQTVASLEKLSFNIDEDNFLHIIAPIPGTVTSVTYTQAGDKVDSKQPFLGIAPADAKNILEIEILERNRGLLTAGQDAKLKFSAFPFQQYGFIEGTLSHISPNTSVSTIDKKSLIYKGRIDLSKTFFIDVGIKHPVRIGMLANAEIVVKKRRLIDIALDPFRNLKSN